MDTFFKYLFPVFFTVVFLIVVANFATIIWLGAKCYMSDDRDSMACYMINDRADITVRQR